MSLKDFFKNSPARDSQEILEVEESEELVLEHSKNEERYIPNVDYSDPSNFAKFGLAEEYYKDAATRILEYYPYDGSLKDKLEWENNSTDLDLYLYKNLWPKTTGYANFSPNGWGSYADLPSVSRRIGFCLPNSLEYIFLKTGPNVDNVYESSSNVTKMGNFYIDSYSGNTIEFWLKISDFPDIFSTDNILKQVILDLHPANDADYFNNRLTIGIYTGSLQSKTVDSGYAGLFFWYNHSAEKIFTTTTTKSNCVLMDDAWHHYSLVFKYNSSFKFELYRDGSLLTNTMNSDYVGTTTSYYVPFTGTIGSLCCPIGNPEDGDYGNIGYGKLSGSIDEFRIWNCARTPEQIKKYYNFIVFGGTNNDDNDSTLGLYYKFNEGITGNTTTDSVVLDYSGRNSNGAWYGYTSNSRSTGSAIAESGLASYEPEDPIILENHPDVVALKSNLQTSGSYHDSQNINNIYSYVPGWILRETEDNDNDTTKNILHIVSTILDEINLKTEKLVDIRSVQYSDNSKYKSSPLAKRVLLSNDFDISELFLNSSFFEEINSKNEEVVYEEKINNIKNFIYQNIYNNLVNLYKSKGTEYSIRNLLNTIGINSNLVKLNLYADNATYDFGTTNYEQKIEKKKYIKFSNNNEAYFSRSFSYLYGEYQAEIDAYFPKYNDLDSELYSPNSNLSSSIAGLYNSSAFLYQELIFVKENLNSKNGYFVLKDFESGRELTSKLFYDVYDNKRWLLLFGYYSPKYDSDPSLDNYHRSFLHCINESENNFYTSSGWEFGLEPFPPIYTLIVGSNTYGCDIDIGSVRVYSKNYINPEEGHKKYFDINNYGTLYPHQNIDIDNRDYIPEEQSIVANWVFDTITGSNSSGQIFVEDFSSGSISTLATRYIPDIYGYNHPYGGYYSVTGSNFEPNSTSVVETKYLISNQQKIPENLCSSDMVLSISSGSYQNFRRDSRPISYIYSLERSYYQNISQEMLNIFSSINAFNNIIGEPVQKYRTEYKSLNKLRNLFYEKVQNVPDIEKYVDLYRWIDKSITNMIMDFVPASTNIIEDNEFIVESHLLERSKYRSKFTNYRNQLPEFLVNMHGIGALDYSWDNFGQNWYKNKYIRSTDRVSVESSSLYYQNYNNVYDISLDIDYKDNSNRLENGKTISYLDLEFKSKSNPPQTPSSFDWSTLDTVEYWDIYTLDYPDATPVSQIIGNYNSLVMTGSRTSYSGSFYGPSYIETENYPRHAWLTGSGEMTKKCISRAYNTTLDYQITYRVDGINPLSGSSNFTTYYVVGIYPSKVCTMLYSISGISDGYTTPPRGFQFAKISQNPGKISLNYLTTGGSSYSYISAKGSDLIYHQFYIIVLIKDGLRINLYTIGENEYTYYESGVDLVEEIWPASNNLNIFGAGTYTLSSTYCVNSSFTWVSLHSKAHSVSEINSVISQINSKQNWTFVSVS